MFGRHCVAKYQGKFVLMKSHDYRTVCVVVVLSDVQGANERGQTEEGGDCKELDYNILLIKKSKARSSKTMTKWSRMV